MQKIHHEIVQILELLLMFGSSSLQFEIRCMTVGDNFPYHKLFKAELS